MRAFMSRSFDRFARKEGIAAADLRAAAGAVASGLSDADLGGGVFKQRIARVGGGKSGGYRTILLFRVGAAVFFVHGFAKSAKANISRAELTAFRRAADVLLGLSGEALARAVAGGELIEVDDDDGQDGRAGVPA